MSESQPFDPRADYAMECPYSDYRQLRGDSPVYQLSESEFVVVDYDTATRVLRDSQTFSVTRLGVGDEEPDPEVQKVLSSGWPNPMTLLEYNGSDHTTRRRLINRVFTPRRLEVVRPGVERIVDRLCDHMEKSKSIEFSREFSLPMSCGVIAEMLGIDDAMAPIFKQWADDYIAQTAARDFDQKAKLAWAQAIVNFQKLFAKEYDKRRINPTDDLLTDLLHRYQQDGREDDMSEMLGQPTDLLVAGMETTANAMTSAMWLLVNHPKELAKVQADASLVPLLVEEVLRYESPIRLRSNRIANRDTELGGLPVPAGSRIVVVVASANRDEAKYSCPEEFRVDRAEAPNLAFGNGVHLCVGAPLARLELQVALTILINRFTDFAMVPEMYDVRHVHHVTFRAIESLEITYKPRDR